MWYVVQLYRACVLLAAHYVSNHCLSWLLGFAWQTLHLRKSATGLAVYMIMMKLGQLCTKTRHLLLHDNAFAPVPLVLQSATCNYMKLLCNCVSYTAVLEQ